MTISMRVETSHKYSFNTDIKMIFKILLVPEKVSIASGFHYIVLLDTSGSMEGMKLDNAKTGAIELFKRIPEGNKATFITFSSHVNIIKEFTDPQDLSDEIISLKASGQTALYTALLTAFNLSRKHEMPSYIVLLTDGNPTDETVEATYKKIVIPEGIQVISFGIGEDYNESILKILADRTGGQLYHVDDPMQIPENLPKAAKTKIAGKNVIVDIISEAPVKILNYSDPPIKINALEGVVKILGETSIPPNYNGNFMTIKLNYEDPLSQRQQALMSIVSLTPAKDQQTFMSGVNKDLTFEYEYYNALQKYSSDVEAGNLVEATKTLDKMNELAQQTRRIELIETTKRLSNSLETTKRIGTVEQTKKLSKEVTSEVTRKLRGES